MSAGAYGNPNLYFVRGCQYITYAGTSENITIPGGTIAVTLRASSDCWVKIGRPGETPVAAAPGAEKTRAADTFVLRTDERLDVPVPLGTDEKPVKIAVIQDSAGGTLDVFDLGY